MHISIHVLRHVRLMAAAAVFLISSALPLPATDYAALAKTVEIRRDEWGVPHILAPTEEAAALALGYAQGEDFPLTISKLFTAARGESAKYFGSKEEAGDVRIKTLGLYEDSQRQFANLTPLAQAQINAFAAGYNLAIEKFKGEKPPCMLPVTGIDVFAHGRNVVSLEFTLNISRFSVIKDPTESPGGEKTGAQARADRDYELAGSLMGGMPFENEESMPGSNMWGIGGSRTASGHGILLANPHLAWSGKEIFYEAHVNVPGVVNISGSTLIGSPGITIGFNEYLGWSHTVNRFDSHDMYELEMDPNNPDRYLYDGLSLPLTKREITIEVLGDSGVQTKVETIYDSHFGPVVMEKNGKKIAQKTPNDHEIRMFEQWNRMGKARNLDEFKDALDLVAIPMFNIAYADRAGNCFYLYNGRIPQRTRGFQWWTNIPGNTSRADWSVVHPVSDLPQLTNPRGGYVQNCNDAPWYTNKQELIDKNKFPFYMCEDGFKLRSMLSVEMLEATGKFTLEKVMEDKMTPRMLAAERFKNDLVSVLEASGDTSGDMKKAIELLKGWDNRGVPDAKGAVLFGEWFTAVNPKMDNMAEHPWSPEEPFTTPRGIKDKAIALEGMQKTITKMNETYGKLDPAWGDIYFMMQGGKRLPLSGGAAELGFFRALSFKPVPPEEAKVPGERICRGGDSYVAAVEFTDPPTAWTITAYGTTELADSPHISDQSELFAAAKFKRAWFTEEDVKAHAKRTYHPGE